MRPLPERMRRNGSADGSSSGAAHTTHDGSGATRTPGNQAAQRAYGSPPQARPHIDPTAAPAGPLEATERLELYQGAEFPTAAGWLTYKREVTITTPRNNVATLTVTGTAKFPPGTAAALHLPRDVSPKDPYPSDYHHVQPGTREQLAMSAETTYRWIVDVWYDDPYLKKWLTFPYHPEGGDHALPRSVLPMASLASIAPDFAVLGFGRAQQFDPAEQYRTLAEFVDRSEDAARAEAQKKESEYEPPTGDVLTVEPGEGEGEIEKQPSDGGILGRILSAIFNFFGSIVGGLKRLWNALPWWARGILKWAAKTAIVIGLVILVATGIVEILGAFGVVVAVATVAKIIGGAMLVYLTVSSVIRLIKEGVNPLAIPGVAIMEAIGVRDMVEALTDRSMTTGVPYNRSKEDRLEAFLTGGTQLLATLFGVSRTLKRKGPATVADPPPGPQHGPIAPAPGQYVPRTGPETVSAADLDRPPPPAGTRSGNVRPPPQGQTHTDPFSGQTYRDSDVMSRAKTQRSLRTGTDAARAEQLYFDDAVRRRYIPLQDPGHANAAGPDSLFARRDPTTGLMEIVFGDATVNRSKSPYRTPPATWVAEARQAIQRLGNSPLENEIRQALASARFVVETVLVEVLPNGVRFTPL